MLDLTRYDEDLKREIARGVEEVFASGRFVMGPANALFEEALAKEIGAAHAVGVSSGTDALLVCFMALEIGPGDEVVTSPLSFFASAAEVARVGARPVFVDVEPDTLTLDPGQLEAAIGPATKAIEPVHLYGQCADMKAILPIAARRGVPVIEDACQAIGASQDGRQAGAMGLAAAFSFYPTKNLGAAGDAGAVTTNDPELAEKLKTLRMHGETSRYHHKRVGGNFRLDAIQAAVLLAKLPRLRAWNARRRAIAALYSDLLSDAARDGRVTLPVERDGRRHIYHQYVVRVRNRDAVRERLTRAGIATAVFYPVPLHRQECFADLGFSEGAFPVAEKAAGEVLALPIFAEMRDDEVERVAEELRKALGPG